MKTRAVRIHGEMDLRLEEFDLPEMKEDEILAKVISDSLCASSYKAAKQGAAHKRVPDDVAENPTIIGHEFCGEIVRVGSKWAKDFTPGDRFIIQPALGYKGSLDAPGYSFRYIGGDATYVIIPHEVMDMKSSLVALGIGMAAGAAAAILLPKNRTVQQAVVTAADAVSTAAEDAKEYVQKM